MESYRKCNNYGKEGHFGKDCPSPARVVACPPVQSPTQHQQRNRGNKLQGTDKVYAMTGVEVAGSGNLVMGRCMIAGESLCMLCDSGATHAFCVKCMCEKVGSVGV